MNSTHKAQKPAAKQWRYLIPKRATDGYTTISIPDERHTFALQFAFGNRKYLACALKAAANELHAANEFPRNFSLACVQKAEDLLFNGYKPKSRKLYIALKISGKLA